MGCCWVLVKCFILWVSVLVVLLLQIQRCFGCLEEERIALLEFKASVNWADFDYEDGSGLPSWVDDRGSDCCDWERVMCNHTTGRVIHISLDGIRTRYLSGNWYLNLTMFSAFEDLQHLNLSWNWLNGWIKNEGFERLIGLRKLEVLDIATNQFNNSILPSLGALTSLRTLSVAYNYMEGSSLWEELSSLYNLQSLDLSGNALNASSQMIQGFERLVGLRKLEVLHLDTNHFNNNILPSLGALTSLRILSLSDNQLDGSIHLDELATLHNLQTLDLSYNHLNASTQTIQGFNNLVGLKKLEFLSLYGNLLDDNIFPSLGRLTSLRTLSLGGNSFEGSSHMEELANLHYLQSLHLSENSMQASSQTIQGFEKLVGLKRLEVLCLSQNQFNNSIFPCLGALTSITTLSLDTNNFEGSSNIEELMNLRNLISLSLSHNAINASSTIEAFCQVKSLQELDLSWNNFEGILPPCLHNMTSLRILDLSHNQFKGNIPSSLLTSLTSLVHISLSYNDFEGTLKFNTFANNSQLEVIDLSSGGNRLEVETEYPPWVPPFQLKEVLLSKCNLNQKTNAFPKFLSNQYQLRKVDLSHNNLKGEFPTWLLENNKMLGFLILKNNSLTGPFPLQSYIHRDLFTIDISNNCIDGLLQENIGKKFPYLEYLNLSKNCFEGGIPSSIGHMKQLFALDMSNNNFSGEFPDNVSRGCINLYFLLLSYNNLHGQLFPPRFNLTRLGSLHLDNNLFSGDILNELSNCSELKVLDISNNEIIGRIPSWIGNLTNLMIFNMRSNLLKGNIPIEFQKLEQLTFLDISYNHLSGSIPSLNSTNLQHLHLEGNGFTGSLPISLINNSNLLALDIRDNNLYGGIPNWIGGLSNLEILLLGRNHFHGPIPDYMCQLARINLMDLSQNTLFGSIPRCFNNITFGRIRDTDSVLVQNSLFDYEVLGFSNLVLKVDELGETEVIEFITKSRSDSYRGSILNFISGLDLSCNSLSGEIPNEIGDFNEILALNLSYNQLTGSIPKSLSNLTQIESLDLSHNKLSKEIPSELIKLNFLEVFTVAYNNLSGKTPEMKAQFATFKDTSYDGNPFLCGPPLARNCSSGVQSTYTSTTQGVEKEDDIDMGIFIVSFVASYAMCLLGSAAVLYINPYWRRMWFHFIEECIHSCCDAISG